jgi:hypothetical protein
MRAKLIARTSAVALLAGLSIAAPVAHASAVFDTPTTTLGNQNYSDNLGLDFTVVKAIRVTALGAFDSGADGISTDITVGIYDLANSVFVSPILNFNSTTATGVSSYAFRDITPFILGPGSYSIIARGFNSTDLNFNTNIDPGINGSSTITFDSLGGSLVNGTSRYGGGAAPGGPSSVVFPFQSAFAGGTFVAAAIPEPATWALMLVGFGMIGFAMRKRSRVRTTVNYA